MPPTYLSTHPGDVQRWAARRDVVPVREGERFALVPAGEAEPDQERLHWNEFFAAGDDQVIVRQGDGADSLSVADRPALLDRFEIPQSQREAIEERLENGETVELSTEDVNGDAASADVVDADATNDESAADEGSAATADRGGKRTRPAERDVGKLVVAASGGELGIVTAVADEELFVDPHAGLAESAMATLGWSNVDEEDVSVDAGRIDAITSTTVRLVDVGDGEAFRETAADR